MKDEEAYANLKQDTSSLSDQTVEDLIKTDQKWLTKLFATTVLQRIVNFSIGIGSRETTNIASFTSFSLLPLPFLLF